VTEDQYNGLLAAHEATRVAVVDVVEIIRATNSLLAVAILLLVLIAVIQIGALVRR